MRRHPASRFAGRKVAMSLLLALLALPAAALAPVTQAYAVNGIGMRTNSNWSLHDSDAIRLTEGVPCEIPTITLDPNDAAYSEVWRYTSWAYDAINLHATPDGGVTTVNGLNVRQRAWGDSTGILFGTPEVSDWQDGELERKVSMWIEVTEADSFDATPEHGVTRPQTHGYWLPKYVYIQRDSNGDGVPDLANASSHEEGATYLSDLSVGDRLRMPALGGAVYQSLYFNGTQGSKPLTLKLQGSSKTFDKGVALFTNLQTASIEAKVDGLGAKHFKAYVGADATADARWDTTKVCVYTRSGDEEWKCVSEQEATKDNAAAIDVDVTDATWVKVVTEGQGESHASDTRVVVADARLVP